MLRVATAVACLALLLLVGCGEKVEPRPETVERVNDTRQFTGEKADVAEVVESYGRLLGDPEEKATICSRIVDLGGPHGRGTRQARQSCMRNPDLGLVVRGADALSVQTIEFGPKHRVIDQPPLATATARASDTDVRLRLRLAGPFWRISSIEVPGLEDVACPGGLRESQIVDGFGRRHPNSRAALAEGFHGEEIARALSRGAIFVPVAETSSSWTWALRRDGETVATFTVEGEPPVYYSSSRDACQNAAVSDSGRGGGQGFRVPSASDGRCGGVPPPGAPGPQSGPPPTVRMPAAAWAEEEGIVRAMYPGSGSSEPCELGIAEGRGGRVVVRVLNPAIATSDLRYWCVEARLPLAAPDIAPARNLDSVGAGIRRQLRSGRGCVRVPYEERPR